MKNSFAAQLNKNGFVTVPYPRGLRAAVVKVVWSWKKFCDLPLDIKKNLPYSNGGDGVGYEMKEGTKALTDRKENFDVTETGRDWLTTHASKIGNSAALQFVEDAVSLVELMKPAVLQFAEQVEKEFGVEGFVDEVKQSEFFIRFIHYAGGNRVVGEEMATSHVDQSGFTFHTFESAAGVQRLDKVRQWINMPLSSGQTVIFPSMQLQLRSKGKLRALCHRVIATPETAVHGRYAGVCFVQLKKTPKYNKEKCGRLAEKVPGFNYDMSHEEFAKMFKK